MKVKDPQQKLVLLLSSRLLEQTEIKAIKIRVCDILSTGLRNVRSSGKNQQPREARGWLQQTEEAKIRVIL